MDHHETDGNQGWECGILAAEKKDSPFWENRMTISDVPLRHQPCQKAYLANKNEYLNNAKTTPPRPLCE